MSWEKSKILTKYQAFCDQYEAYFGTTKGIKNQDWKEFVERSSEDTLKAAFGVLEEVFTAKKIGGYHADPPTLGMFMREYDLAKCKNRGHGSYCNPECSQCGGVGTVIIVKHRITQQAFNPQQPEPYCEADLAFTYADCPHAPGADGKNHRGWMVQGGEMQARVFIKVCHDLWENKVNKKPMPDKSPVRQVAKIEHWCPECGDKFLVDGFEDMDEQHHKLLYALLRNVHCDSCAEKKNKDNFGGSY